ncbi:glycosyltransferase family 2 protein [Wenzhouxiangella sp. XN24]|nr:glycosyltransferase family 2 protein [Wenzhouxiangella sp. XN24]
MSQGSDDTQASQPSLSVVVPLYNEEESATALYDAVCAALDPSGLNYELLLVDDGSRDRTWQIVQDIASTDARVRGIRFRRNFGQTPAMAAGIEYARGSVIVTMDGDLQNDPRDIPMLVAKLDEGFDLVVGWRFDRQDKLVSRKIPSKIANWLIGRVTGVPIKDNGCSLKAYRAKVIKNVPLYSEMHRFIPAMARISGAEIAELKVRHHARQFGTSKYGISRTWRVLMDLVAIKTLSRAATQPMHWFSRLSLPLLMMGLPLLGYAMYEFIAAEGRSPVVFAGAGLLLVSSGVMMLFTGVLVELAVRTGDARLIDATYFLKRLIDK